MGAALNQLTVGEREDIARELLTDALPQLVHGRVSSHCPFHTERTPGGAFFYDPADDVGFCHSCGQGSDLVGIYNALQGNDPDDPQGFRDFFERFAPGRAGERGQRAERIQRTAWQPRRVEPSPALWARKAEEFVAKRAATLLETPEAIAALHRWGITPETARLCRIGWVSEERFYKYSAWGLPFDTNDKGRERCIYAPVGLVFPCYQRGELVRVKIRVHKPADNQPNYRAINGGPANYGVWGRPESTRVWIVVETERDAILCWQELRHYGIGAMSTGSASIAPDEYAHTLLSRADCIVNALDNDHAGRKKSWSFVGGDHRFAWSQYPHAVRWLVPACIGKDVGDLPAAGVGVWDWLRIGLPPHIREACERNAERIAAKRAAEAAAPRVLPFPSADGLSLDGPAGAAYAEVIDCAERYNLRLRVEAGVLSVVYAEGAEPHGDADRYVQALIDDPANGLRPVLQGVAA